MKIGIDLDGVIFDSEKEFRVYSELYDMLELKQNSKLDNRELKFQDRLITARGGMNKDMIKITEERLKESEMDIFDKYYWATENKDEVCEKENVDIMIDDFNEKCESIANKKIKTIYLKYAPSYDLKESEYIKVLYNWEEIYRYIKEINN